MTRYNTIFLREKDLAFKKVINLFNIMFLVIKMDRNIFRKQYVIK